MTHCVKTTIEFDLSKLQSFSPDEAFDKLHAACVREMIKVAFETQSAKCYFISKEDPSQKKDTLPQCIQCCILSDGPLDFLQGSESLTIDSHTIVPVHYDVESISASIEETLHQRKLCSSSEYISKLIKRLPSNPEDFRCAEKVLDVTCKNLNLDEKIENLLKNQSLLEQIQVRYPFFYEAIQAYQSKELNLILPENWPVKRIMRIIKSESVDELRLFSMLCLKIQHERSHGKTLPNILTKTQQQEPLHIGLFDTYQVYLCSMQETLDRMQDKNPFKIRCVKLFEALKFRLQAFMDNHYRKDFDIDPLRQNAWINILLRVKSLFLWIELFCLPRKESRKHVTEKPWEPFFLLKYQGENHFFQGFFFKRVSYSTKNDGEIIEDICSDPDTYPRYLRLNNFEIVENIKLHLKRSGFDIERYMQDLESEVAEGVYTFSSDPSHETGLKTIGIFQKILNSSDEKVVKDSYPSGVGCHLEISEDLNERDLILMNYTTLTPVGNFMPLEAFHDGAWRSPLWLRPHDSFHAASYVRIFERMGCEASDTSIGRYRNIDKIDGYLEIIHKILNFSEDPKRALTEAERNYIRLYLFMSHEVSLDSNNRKLDLLDMDFHSLNTFHSKDLQAILQDLLFSMKIRVEEQLKDGTVKTILPGDYELKDLIQKAHPVYRKLKRDALVDYINEKLLI